MNMQKMFSTQMLDTHIMSQPVNNDYEEPREDKLPNEKIIPFSKLYNKSLNNLGDYAG